jgi:hypothetical protein
LPNWLGAMGSTLAQILEMARLEADQHAKR